MLTGPMSWCGGSYCPPGNHEYCRCNWCTTTHCLGAEQRHMKIKTSTNFLEGKSLILEINKGQWNLFYSPSRAQSCFFPFVGLHFCLSDYSPRLWNLQTTPSQGPSQVFHESELFLQRPLDQKHSPDRKRNIRRQWTKDESRVSGTVYFLSTTIFVSFSHAT